ncbi:DUF554 domain-containing protein [Streptococcus iniae]|uniref:DUF554 domain-containing protein n=1 Tax=Streptococcus iniae TaxID=1346 RepID=UPI002B2D59A6|nr:DUF554 domain-containing protein [Streptococcus iniae]WNZ94939.1 DUF554 domain-containing protein [Streptococcus iniae]
MFALGTLIDTVAIFFAGFCGNCFGHKLTARHQESLTMATGISVLFIGISGAMSGMLSLRPESLASGHSMLVVASLSLGALIGEIINIEGNFEKFGNWLKISSGNAKDPDFVNAFVVATLTVCIGAMAIIGPIQDGINGDISLLITKSVLDFIIIIIMTTSLGKGAIFSAIPILVFQGSITILASFLKPVLTLEALTNISLVGSILIFCVGLNIVFEKGIRVANMLPALVLAALVAYF